MSQRFFFITVTIILGTLNFSVKGQSSSQFNFANKYIDSLTGRIIFKEVVPATGNKQQLYSKAKEWFIRNYNSGKDIIQLDDPANGKIIGRAPFSFQSMPATADDLNIYNNTLWYTITINVKDGAYRYVISDFGVQHHNEKEILDLEAVLKKMNELNLSEQMPFYLFPYKNTTDLITSLKKQMNSKDDF